MSFSLMLVAKFIGCIVVFDILVVLGLMLSLRVRRDEIAEAPYRTLTDRWTGSFMEPAHRHRLPVQDGWSRDETIAWARSGRDFPERLFNLQQMTVSFSPDEACPVCVGRLAHTGFEKHVEDELVGGGKPLFPGGLQNAVMDLRANASAKASIAIAGIPELTIDDAELTDLGLLDSHIGHLPTFVRRN